MDFCRVSGLWLLPLNSSRRVSGRWALILGRIESLVPDSHLKVSKTCSNLWWLRKEQGLCWLPNTPGGYRKGWWILQKVGRNF